MIEGKCIGMTCKNCGSTAGSTYNGNCKKCGRKLENKSSYDASDDSNSLFISTVCNFFGSDSGSSDSGSSDSGSGDCGCGGCD